MEGLCTSLLPGEGKGQNDRCYWPSYSCHRRWQESPLLTIYEI